MSEDALPLLRNFLLQRYAHIKSSLTLKLGNAELAGDALQETWLRLQRSAAISGPVLNPHAYLMRIAVNLSVDIRRSQGRLLSVEDVDALMDELPDPGPGPDRMTEDSLQLEALVAILTRMPSRRREILLLVRIEGWSHEAVSRRMGVSRRTIEYELKAAQEYCSEQLRQHNGI